MKGLVAAVVLGGVFSGATAHAAPALEGLFALQANRGTGHQGPEHHLQEARRALDRAWQKSRGDDRRSLDLVRSDVAALALAYEKIPAVAQKSDDVGPSAAADVPPAAGTKPLAEWQQKYADVNRDLKAFATDDRSTKTRIDHARTHLEMFYASALGKNPGGH